MLETQGTIRNATLLDCSAIARLVPSSASDVCGWIDHVHLLVLEVDHSLAAVVHVIERDGEPAIDLLAVDAALAPPEAEQRMCGVARALCEAYAPPRRTRGRR